MSLRVLTLAGFTALGVMTAAAPAKAQSLIDFGRVLLGLPADEAPPIDYRERPPLVVPPSQNLRPPVPAVEPDQRRANWPQDPDVLARRKAAQEARVPLSLDSLTRGEDQPTRRMTAQEIRAGRVAGQEVNRTPTITIDDRERSSPFGGVTALREMDKRSAEEAASLDRAEPRREFLTDPPVGLRAPSGNAPVRATREGSLGASQPASPYDVFQPERRTR
jgi:hypothetical protein